MPASVHAALVISIVASALGALVMCLLVARYGLTPAEDSDGATQRLIVTRFGHAVAGVCFAATAIMAVVALAVPRPTPPAPTVVAAEPDRAAEVRLQALAADVKALAARLDQRLDQIDGRVGQIDGRVGAVDGSARQLGDELASLSLRARQLERAMAPAPRRATASEPAPKPQAHEVVREPVVPRDSPRVSERFVPAQPAPLTADVPAAAPPPLASDPAAAVRTPAPAARTPERTTPPVVRAPEPAPRSVPTAARASETATSRPHPAEARAPEPGPARSTGGGATAAKASDDLGDKFREDWKAIRGGFSTAADDFKSAVRDLGRKLWR